MVDWTTSKEYEEIRELQTNNIALQGSVKETENVTLSLDCSESLVERLTQQTRELQETVNASKEVPEFKARTCQH